MKKNLCLLLFLSFYAGFSQINYEKGYFVNNGGQRTECFIKNLDWRSNPTTFQYKLQLTDDSKTGDISEIKEFAIDNESMFRRYTVQLETSQNTITNPNLNKNPEWQIQTVFLKSIVLGEANLYALNIGNIEKYFYETKSRPIEQLVMILYTANSTIYENNQYKQQLLNHVKCEKMSQNQFSNLEYNRKSLSKHFEAYNNCKGDNKTKTINYVANEKQYQKFNLRFTPGVYFASANIVDPYKYYDSSIRQNQMIFKIGFDAEFVLPFNKNSWSFFVNPTYSKFDPVTNYTSHVRNPGFADDGDPIAYTAETSYSNVELPIGIRCYTFINNASKLFFNVAYVLSFAMSDSHTTITNQSNLVNAHAELLINNKDNFAGGIGYCYKKFSAEIRYNTPRELVSYKSWKNDYSTIGLNFGYKIF